MALRVLMCFGLLKLASLAFLLLIVLQLGLHLLKVDLGLPLRGDDVDVKLGRVLIIEAMMQHLQLL